MNIQPVTSTASKAQEMETLRKVAKLFEPGTYMHDFFSERLISWVEQQLRDDFPPDVFMLVDRENDELRNARATAEAAQAVLHENERTHAQEVAKWKSEVDNLNEQIVQLNRQLDWTCKQRDENHETIGEVSTVLFAAQEQVETLQREVVELKAKLYDLISK